MKNKCFSWGLLVSLLMVSCASMKQEELAFVHENIDFVCKQTQNMLNASQKGIPTKYPRTTSHGEKTCYTSIGDWTPGYFPGTLWYLYELTGDTAWQRQAERWTSPLERLKNQRAYHDIGLIIQTSFGQAQRLAPKEKYQDIIVNSARSLASRYNPVIESVESWNYRKAWNGNEWFFPVIIDNMMCIELLCTATNLTGDPSYKDMALKHANTTLKNHIREDFSCYHVVNYDQQTGNVLHKQTCQGYSDNSTWARGQAWAVYGFTMMYRETENRSFLKAAKECAHYYLKHLPEDMVPIWDFNAGEEGYTPDGQSGAKDYMNRNTEPRDASATAIVCSALFELGELSHDKSFTDTAVKMLHSLASSAYRAPLGKYGNFLIMHNTGSIPHHNEVDEALVYADYYFVEALTRYKNLLEKGTIY